jgi:hypothetical protein
MDPETLDQGPSRRRPAWSRVSGSIKRRPARARRRPKRGRARWASRQISAASKATAPTSCSSMPTARPASAPPSTIPTGGDRPGRGSPDPSSGVPRELGVDPSEVEPDVRDCSSMPTARPASAPPSTIPSRLPPWCGSSRTSGSRAEKRRHWELPVRPKQEATGLVEGLRIHQAASRASIDPRLVRRWAVGDRPIPPWVAPVLASLLQERSKRELLGSLLQ